MRHPLLSACLAAVLLSACGTLQRTPASPLGTDDARALQAWRQGWEAIMDEGRWTLAEEHFREAWRRDPHWVLGQALVARITEDLAERQALLHAVESGRDRVHPDVGPILDVFLMNIRAMNARDEGRSMPDGFGERRMALALEAFASFCARHPDEVHLQAERIEWLHAAHGADVALEATAALPDTVRAAPFFTRYAIRLEIERGNLGRAWALLTRLERLLDDPDAPAIHTARAGLLTAEGRHAEALVHARHAQQLDPANLTARGQVARLEAALAPAPTDR